MSDVIATQWPYDGPHGRDSVTSAAGAMADLVRYLNNATGPGNAAATLEWASTIDLLLHGVDRTIGGLDQLLGQLSVALTAQADSASLYDDRRDRPGHDTALAAAAQLRRARRTLQALALDVVHVVDATHHLGNRVPEDGEQP